MVAVNMLSVPALRRGIRRQFDAVRGTHVLQGPERVVVLDDVANAIAQRCDAQHSIKAMVAALAVEFATDAALIEPDVIGFVQELVDKGLVVI